MSFPQEKFLMITRKYLDHIIEHSIEPEKDFYVIMEPYASLNTSRVLSYFNSAKIIIVHRDPRDAYINLKRVITDYFPVKEVDHFIKGFLNLQLKFEQQKIDDGKVLVINFEDLILDYDGTADKILEFLMIDKKLLKVFRARGCGLWWRASSGG